MNRFFMIGCHALLAISAVVLIYLYGMRKNLIEDCKQELLEGVSRSAREVSNRIENKFITLETIQDLVSRSYEIGQESAEPLESARERYAMSSLGVVDKNYIYYDSSGESVPDISHEQIDRVFSGAKTVICSTDGYAPDGLVFAVPYRKDGEIIGAICSKYPAGDLIAGLESKVLDVAELIVDSAGNLVFSSNDFGEYIGNELTWEEVSRNGVKLTQKKQFDDEMLKNQSAVSSAKNRLGERIYFAAARVMSYNDFYVIHFTNSKIVEEKIQNTMLWAYLMLALMTMCMIFLIVGAAVTYSKNRKKIYREAYENPLTKIPAKTKHKLDAQELIDKQENKYAYVTFDIDNFKYINEVFGYEYGNRVLIHIANVIKEFASEKELYAHISGDNFALLLIDEGTEEELSQRIQKLFTTITESQGEDSDLNLCKLKISCGVYRIEGATDINHVRANANIARTECKKQVLHDIVYYDEALKARRVEERELEYDAEDALKNGEFLVYFQPKYDVATERIIGAEALIRWNHSVRGMLSPGIFVPLFETTGFIIELDMYVLEQVCKLIAAWLKKGITPVCISVNLSRTHLYEQNLVKRLVSVVKKYNVPPNYIEFELTESAFYEQSGTLLQVMEDIKREGFRLSMDDFGSGYSSLNLLRRLPVDVLKLDKEFLAEDGGGDDIERGKRIVMHVISMAKDLEISVLAEGVETKGDKDFLQEARCDMIQGYYFAKPMPMSEFDSLYTEKDSNILLEKG
ncbi:MAG: EAL domain-containing protein [Lachnospiraceae bacterium]|nr:EAL domain-containing protein [Lachnospiraceae bacterium]